MELSVDIFISDDDFVESDEQFTINLALVATASNVLVDPDEATIRINDDDGKIGNGLMLMDSVSVYSCFLQLQTHSSQCQHTLCQRIIVQYHFVLTLVWKYHLL